MSNSYLTITQLYDFVDERVVKRLSGDRNSPDGNTGHVQAIIDACAAHVETILTGRVTVPPTSATALLFLRQMIADKAHARLYMRRTDAPKAVLAAARMADEWLSDFMNGKVTLPGESGAVPVLHKSTYVDGRSRFSHVLGQMPTATETDG